MKKTISVRVIPNAKYSSLDEKEGGLVAHIAAAPSGNKANAALVSLLAEHFYVRRGDVRIIRGAKSRLKRVEVNL